MCASVDYLLDQTCWVNPKDLLSHGFCFPNSVCRATGGGILVNHSKHEISSSNYAGVALHEHAGMINLAVEIGMIGL